MSDALIFLDFDGVLNSQKFFEKNPSAYDDYLANKLVLDPDAVSYLNEAIRRSGARVVISSAWRKRYGIGELKSRLRRAGLIREAMIIGRTPSIGDGIPRGHEICSWMVEHGQGAPYVVLDDRDDMEPCLDSHVMTDPRLGLGNEHIPIILNILRQGRI